MATAAVALDAGVVDRMRGALWGVYIADALSMPVHWCELPSASQLQGPVTCIPGPA
jgi:hypothetical protein